MLARCTYCKRKRMTDLSIPQAAETLIARHGREGAQREASRRGDDARTTATATFYERLHHYLRTQQ